MVGALEFVPERGDVVYLDHDPRAGHEQGGRRPALVISPKKFNQTGLALLCPITNTRKEWGFNVDLPEGLGVTGVILSDQIKSLDWSARKAEFHSKVPGAVIEEVIGKIKTLIY